MSPPLPNVLVISNGRIEIKSTIFIEDCKNDNFLGDEINLNMYSNVNQLLQIEFIIMHVFHICTPSGNSGFTAGILSTQKTTIDSNMISTDTTAKILPGNEEFGCSNNIHIFRKYGFDVNTNSLSSEITDSSYCKASWDNSKNNASWIKRLSEAATGRSTIPFG